jgi:hypothetical protein
MTTASTKSWTLTRYRTATAPFRWSRCAVIRHRCATASAPMAPGRAGPETGAASASFDSRRSHRQARPGSQCLRTPNVAIHDDREHTGLLVEFCPYARRNRGGLPLRVLGTFADRSSANACPSVGAVCSVGRRARSGRARRASVMSSGRSAQTCAEHERSQRREGAARDQAPLRPAARRSDRGPARRSPERMLRHMRRHHDRQVDRF